MSDNVTPSGAPFPTRCHASAVVDTVVGPAFVTQRGFVAVVQVMAGMWGLKLAQPVGLVTMPAGVVVATGGAVVHVTPFVENVSCIFAGQVGPQVVGGVTYDVVLMFVDAIGALIDPDPGFAVQILEF